MGMEAVKPIPQTHAPEIALVDDDPLFLDTLAANLRGGGYRVATFTTTKAILAGWFEGLRPAAILAEVRVAQRDHGALTRALRSIGYAGPIVLLTPEGSPVECEGGTDAIAKTLPPGVILRHLARVTGEAAPCAHSFSVGALEIDAATERALWRTRPINLSRCEFAITALLAAGAGVTVTYREIFRTVTEELFANAPADEGYRMVVRAAVERLRYKFLAVDRGFTSLEHQAGLGYRWRP
jgi:two-component system response regulator ChvI